MNPILSFFFLVLVLSSSPSDVSAQTGGPGDMEPQPDVAVSFKPSIAIVIGILSIMFSLTFLLLMYAKFCSSAAAGLYSARDPENQNGNGLLPWSRFSGIDKKVVESLPFFLFSSLKGSREGLECAVCLSKFEDTEVLRLLPKCKHAFHIDCVDRWLENHSSCPLCRYKVEVEDLTVFKYSNSSRFLFRNPSTRDPDATNLDLYIEREPDENGERRHGSSRFSIGGSFRKVAEWGRSLAATAQKDDSLLPEDGGVVHKFKHKITMSDVVFKNRWSDLNSSDLTSLNSEMLNMESSRRFSALDSNSDRYFVRAPAAGENGFSADDTILSIKEEMERKRALESKAGQMMNQSISVSVPTTSNGANPKSLITSGNRSMSEITNLSRCGGLAGMRNGGGGGVKDEKVRRLWLPIARRTVQWFAGRERRSSQSQSQPSSSTNV